MVQDGRKGRWGIANNGEIIFTYAEAQKKFGMFRSTFCRSTSQLVEFGFRKDNWEEQTGRKLKRKSKIGINNDTNSSITNDTRDHQTPIAPSIIHATHQIDPNYFIQKGLEVFKAMHPSPYH
jgi:hypothetical protein